MLEAEKIVDLLRSNWNSANTENTIPEIGLIYDYKQIDLSLKDYILVYQGLSNITPESVGYPAHFGTTRVTIDIRTMNGRERLEMLRDEVMRIIRTNHRKNNGFFLITVDSVNDLSDKTIKLYRQVIDVSISEVMSG